MRLGLILAWDQFTCRVIRTGSRRSPPRRERTGLWRPRKQRLGGVKLHACPAGWDYIGQVCVWTAAILGYCGGEGSCHSGSLPLQAPSIGPKPCPHTGHREATLPPFLTAGSVFFFPETGFLPFFLPVTLRPRCSPVSVSPCLIWGYAQRNHGVWGMMRRS